MRLSVVSVLLASVVYAQTQTPATPTPDPNQTIRVHVNEVVVPVTITDKDGRFVNDLDLKDSRIYDEGKEQKITFFTRERGQPVVTGFLIDLSNANRLQWKTYQEAAQELVLTLMPGDSKKFQGYLISYANEPELQMNTTNDPEKLIDKLRKMKPAVARRFTTRSTWRAPAATLSRASRSSPAGSSWWSATATTMPASTPWTR